MSPRDKVLIVLFLLYVAVIGIAFVIDEGMFYR